MSQETRTSPKDAVSHATAKPPRASALKPRTDLSRVVSSPAGIPVGSPASLAAPPLEEAPSVVTIGVTLDATVASGLMKTAEAMGYTLGELVAALASEWMHDAETKAELVETLPAPEESEGA
jgi:hypothetical protein